jgi:hypothetical protein
MRMGHPHLTTGGLLGDPHSGRVIAEQIRQAPDDEAA